MHVQYIRCTVQDYLLSAVYCVLPTAATFTVCEESKNIRRGVEGRECGGVGGGSTSPERDVYPYTPGSDVWQ